MRSHDAAEVSRGIDSGERPGATTGDKQRIAELERGVRELRRVRYCRPRPLISRGNPTRGFRASRGVNSRGLIGLGNEVGRGSTVF